MVLARFQRTIVDDAGNILPGASVTVRSEATGAPLAVIYSDRAGTTPIGNPFTVGGDGLAAFYVAGGAYRITATSGSSSIDWRYVGIGTAQEHDWDFSIVSSVGYLDFTEIADPGAPDADFLRAFVYDVGGISTLALRDSAGVVFQISATGAFFAAASKLDFASGDVTITHSTNALAFAGASGGYAFDADMTVTGGIFRSIGIAPGVWLEETANSPAKGLLIVNDGGLLQFQRRAAGFGALEATIVQIDTDAPDLSLTINSLGNVGLAVDLAVSEGGSGRSSATAYAIICGGITSDAAHQSIASVGTSGQVLTSNGAGALPTFQTSGSAAGVVLLNSGTLSSQATLDIVLTSFTAYKYIELKMDSVVPATDDVDLWLRFSTNGGSSYDATGYTYAHVGLSDSNGGRNANSAASNQILIAGVSTAGDSISNTASEGGVDITVTIYGRTSTGRWSSAKTEGVYHNASGNELTSQNGAGHRETTQDTDAIRILFESGNIASGNWALYGYA